MTLMSFASTAIKLVVTLCLSALLLIVILPRFVLADIVPQPQKNISANSNSTGKILTVTIVDSTVLVSPNLGSWNFGDIDPITYNDGSGYSVSHQFTLINNNKDAVVVKAVEGSNFRVSYNLPLLQKSLPVTVPADGMITIELVYHLLPLEPDRMDVSAKVLIDDQIQPAAILQCTGVVQPVVTFDPPVLDFGTMTPGQVLSKPIKITYDQHMFPGIMPLPPEKLPHVASGEPFINVKQTAIGFTTRYKLAYEDMSKEQEGSNNEGGDNQSAKDFFHKRDLRLLEQQRQVLDALPPLNNVVTCVVTVTAPAKLGAFRGFIVILPVDGTEGTEVLEQENAVVQGKIVPKK